MMIKKISFNILFLFLIFAGYAQNSAHSNSQIHQVISKRVMQTTSYTYLQVLENDSVTWLAVPKMEATVGKVYFYTGGMEMRNFKSAELDTVFYSIFFLSGVFDEKAIEPKVVDSSKLADTNTVIVPIEDGISITELLSNASNYANKTVKLKGRVVKFNSGIMGLN